MRKLTQLTIVLISFLSLHFCRTEDTQKDNLNFKSTTKISETLLGLGLKNISIENNTIHFTTYQDFLYHDKLVNFSDYIIHLNNNVLSTNQSELTTDENGELILKNKFVKFKKLKEIDFKTQANEDDIVLILTYIELTSNDTSILGRKISFNDKAKEIQNSKLPDGGGCSFFNIRRACGFGFTQAEADADLWIATANFANAHMGEGCTSIGGVSHKDAGFAVIAIQSFCCP